MDIMEIEDAILELECTPTTPENVAELASLYIVRDNLSKAANRRQIEGITGEIQDILPAYKKYCDIKRQYQLHEVTEDSVLHQLTITCQEILDLFTTLYAGTDMVKERKQLRGIIVQLYKKYCK